MAAKILKFNGERLLVMADKEHYTVELFDWISERKHEAEPVYVANSEPTIWQRGGGRSGMATGQAKCQGSGNRPNP